MDLLTDRRFKTVSAVQVVYVTHTFFAQSILLCRFDINYIKTYIILYNVHFYLHPFAISEYKLQRNQKFSLYLYICYIFILYFILTDSIFP